MKTKLLDHDHTEMDQVLAAFFTALSQRDVEQSFQTLDFFWARLAVHIRAEHLQLFPALIQAAEAADPRATADHPSAKEVRETTALLRRDHDFFMVEFFHLMKLMRAQRKPGVFQADAAQVLDRRVNEVKKRLQTHNALEEARVYRWAGVLLSPDECDALNERMQRDLANLPPRFRPK